ncbi:MAG: DUF3179 domain-containing protein [Candidatus Latescibacteria bacterium]|nr:DUF3179 domain-containing protein [Candidatus Latescibacterota bacterium]
MQPICLTALLLCSLPFTLATAQTVPGIDAFLWLPTSPGPERAQALADIEQHWQDGFTPMILESAYFSADEKDATQLIDLLTRATGQDHGLDFDRWYHWLWNQDLDLHPEYADFKSIVYRIIDPAFAQYFSSQQPVRIRLDEVRWGGVAQDGIPPLRQPPMLKATAADYLADDHIVFGVQLNGDARAYPKRILAWHEMFVDQVGGIPVAGVYCTLCGTMVLYKTLHQGTNHQLGTSGFLYRSNKLMYDQATQSLWSTLRGEPVIGPLATQPFALERLWVVTTTWGEWRRRHPDTQVMSLDTGHQRDYSEGAAYRDYFATDKLMFGIPQHDDRLLNKDEVLGLVAALAQPLALAVSYLADHPLHHDRLGKSELVVLTDHSGAARAYATGGLRFKSWDRDRTAVDTQDNHWTLSEEALHSADGRSLPRLPAHRAFWFGWQAAYSQTRLVQ